MTNLFKAITLAGILFATPALAGHEHSQSDRALDTTQLQQAAKHGSCHDKINVKAKGMYCELCARKLESSFGERKEVKGINVDIKSGNIDIATHPGKSLSDMQITKSIQDAGFNVIRINRGCHHEK